MVIAVDKETSFSHTINSRHGLLAFTSRNDVGALAFDHRPSLSFFLSFPLPLAPPLSLSLSRLPHVTPPRPRHFPEPRIQYCYLYPPPVSTSRNRAPPRPPKGLMSLRDYTVIHAALEIVVHWGVVPVLETGVGVFEYDKRPRSRAVKLSRRVLHFWGLGEGRGGGRASSARHASGVSSTLGDGGGGAQERAQAHAHAHAQLAVCTGVIQGVVSTDQFMPMLMPLYLPDLLAARLQLVYGRAATAISSTTTTSAAAAASTTTDHTPMADPRLHVSTPSGVGIHSAPSDRPATLPTPVMESNRRAPSEGAATSLNAMLVYLGPRQVMAASRQLLSQGTRAPPWFRQRVGRILSEIVLRPGGVQATLEVYIAAGAGTGGGEAGEGDEVKACLRVAKLLATPPKAVGVGTYVARVAPQLAEMLHYDGQQRATITR